MISRTEISSFKPSMLGKVIEFLHEGIALVTDETVDQMYVESEFYTGWMYKSDYWDSLGVED